MISLQQRTILRKILEAEREGEEREEEERDGGGCKDG